MKATDLMCGDWVLINNTPHKIQSIDSIDAEIQADDELYYVGEDRYHSEDKIEGIPLTPEILDKNGWLNGPYSRLSLQDGKWLEFYWHEHRLQKYWEGIDEWQNHTKQLELVFKAGCIFYVHGLQHALRLCGLKELADNFKV